jgi:hypothetical protein
MEPFKLKNISDEQSSAFVTFQFLSGNEVLSDALFTSSRIQGSMRGARHPGHLASVGAGTSPVRDVSAGRSHQG